jgi:hypothetical protein
MLRRIAGEPIGHEGRADPDVETSGTAFLLPVAGRSVDEGRKR